MKKKADNWSGFLRIYAIQMAGLATRLNQATIPELELMLEAKHKQMYQTNGELEAIRKELHKRGV